MENKTAAKIGCSMIILYILGFIAFWTIVIYTAIHFASKWW